MRVVGSPEGVLTGGQGAGSLLGDAGLDRDARAFTIRYGGNTACVEVRSDSGAVIVLDCGTGARRLGQELAQELRARTGARGGSLLIGHTHWDHIQGLPFFAPLFDDGAKWDLYGPRGLGESLAQTLAGQMQYKYFPVTLEQLSAQVAFHDLVEGSFEIDDLRISTQYLNHPALTLGYRIEGDGVTVVYACDHEPFDPALASGGDVAASPGDARHVQFLAGADLVIHDAQYLPAEYPGRRGWGHSTAEYAVSVAAAAEVGTLVLTHHDPDHADEIVDAKLETARAVAAAIGFRGEVIAAAEGDTVEVRRSAHAASDGRDVSRSAEYVPATADLSACIVLAAADPAVRNAVAVAAAEEQLPLVDAADDVPGAQPNAVVVLDRDDPTSVRAAMRNRARRPCRCRLHPRASRLAVRREHRRLAGVAGEHRAHPHEVACGALAPCLPLADRAVARERTRAAGRTAAAERPRLSRRRSASTVTPATPARPSTSRSPR